MTTIECINYAIENNKAIRIEYMKFDGTISVRTISDIRDSDEYGEGYIRAYCHLRGEDRTFKISRIRKVEIISNTRTTPTNSVKSPNTDFLKLQKEQTDKYKEVETTKKATTSTYNSSYSSKSEGCYIATMVYGDYDHPQVMVLRNYRDQILKTYLLGRWFISLYYYFSPKAVRLLQSQKRINLLIRKALDEFVEFVKKRYFYK